MCSLPLDFFGVAVTPPVGGVVIELFFWQFFGEWYTMCSCDNATRGEPARQQNSLNCQWLYTNSIMNKLTCSSPYVFWEPASPQACGMHVSVDFVTVRKDSVQILKRNFL